MPERDARARHSTEGIGRWTFSAGAKRSVKSNVRFSKAEMRSLSGALTSAPRLKTIEHVSKPARLFRSARNDGGTCPSMSLRGAGPCAEAPRQSRCFRSLPRSPAETARLLRRLSAPRNDAPGSTERPHHIRAPGPCPHVPRARRAAARAAGPPAI